MPLPDRPMMQTVSFGKTSRLQPRRTWLEPKYFSMPVSRTIGTAPGRGQPARHAIRIDASRQRPRSQPHVAHGQPSFEPALEVREEDRQGPVDEGRDEQRLDELAVAAADGIGPPQELLERRRR